MPRPKLTRVSSDGGSYNHPEGGFVLVITGATEDAAQEYMEISYDIAEGEHAGHYEFSNSFRRYYAGYKPGDPSAFDKFMSALEESNPGFDMMEWEKTWNVYALVGKKVGAVFKKRMYTDNSGNDREQPRIHYCCSVDSIRSGKYKVPEPVDDRTVVKPATVSSYDPDEPVPFV